MSRAALHCREYTTAVGLLTVSATGRTGVTVGSALAGGGSSAVNIAGTEPRPLTGRAAGPGRDWAKSLKGHCTNNRAVDCHDELV